MTVNLSHSGYGTRLRPLTLTVAKSSIYLVDKPIIVHQMEALAKVGVKEIFLALNYKAKRVCKTLEPHAKRLGMKVIYINEEEPLGTAGCLALAKKYLNDEEEFFMLNSDVICGFPFQELLDFHKQNKAEATILTTTTLQPEKYGVIIHDENGKISQFVEKPKEFIGNHINSGIYIINSSVLSLIEPRPTSMEKEIFPKVIERGGLYCIKLKGFWADIGNPSDYLIGTNLYLDNTVGIGGNYVSKRAFIGKDCQIGPNVVISDDCMIGDNVRLNSCVIMTGAKVLSGAYVENSIVGCGSTVGKWCHLSETTVIGEDVQLNDGLVFRGTKILPHKNVSENAYTPKKIIM